MRKFFTIAFVLTLLLSGGARDAWAQSSCVNLSKAMALASWAVATKAAYSQVPSDRDCSSSPSGMSGAPSGSPTSTGYCKAYDCSSFATWILRQIPGQETVPAAPGAIPSTYILWGSYTAGPQNGSPSGMKPCDPTKQPVCLGLTEFGEGGSGPGHVVTALCGKVYSSSPPTMDNYATPVPGTMQNSSEGVIVWITPFGLENATMNSCSSSCSSSSVAGGFGGAGVNGSAANAADAAEEYNMMDMMEMMDMMDPMMQAMDSLGSLGSQSANKQSSNNSNNNSSNGSGASTAGSAAAATGSGTAANAAAATSASGVTASSGTVTGGFSSLVGRLSSVLAGSSSTAPATAAGAASATTTASGLTASAAAQDLQNLDQQAADETPLTTSGLLADPAAADPTADYHAMGLPDHRLSCSLTAGASVDSCRSATAP